MRGRLLAVGGAVVTVAAVLPSSATTTSRSSGVEAVVTATSASLGDGIIRRTWSVRPDGSVVTTGLTDERTHQSWVTAPAADFSVSLDGLPSTGWKLTSLTAGATRPDPARPQAQQGKQLTFRYALLGVELERDVVLRPGSAMLETTSTLLTTAPTRVASYSLDELTSAKVASTEVQAYHGGSDWRDDYRVPTVEKGAFDDEGEVARLDDGKGSGVFLVTERRSGVMSRVGRDANGRTWAGVDHARDAFDFGPLRTDAPDYNRLDNPAYPVPARARLVTGQLRLGRAFTGVYSGGAQEAGFAFTSAFARNIAPDYQRSIGLNSFHPWNHGPGMSDANLRTQALLAKKLGVETFMLDDQWQGGADGESGDWQFDPERFPDANKDGTPDFVAFLRQQHLKLGLWMSLAEFNKSSTTYKQHPDWVCAPVGVATSQVDDDAGLGVWDLNNPTLRAYLTTVVDRLVAKTGATELKFDFQAWLDCGTHDYLDYEDAFLGLVRDLQARHPGVTIELDETNDQRAWPFESAAVGPSWFDNGHLHGSTAQAKELHDLWVAAPWLPTSSIGFGFLDGTLQGPYTADYLAPMGLLSHLTFWTDQAKVPASARPELAFWLHWYAAHRADLAGAAYELTTHDPLDGASPVVLEPWAGDHGEVFAFWQSAAKPLTVGLRGVTDAARYRVTDVRTGHVLGTFRGADLRHGLALRPTGRYSAQVLTVTPVSS